MSAAVNHSPDPNASSSPLEELSVFNSTYPYHPLRYKKKIVGSFFSIPGHPRSFLVKPESSVPLKDIELGAYLEAKYAKFDLSVHEEGVIHFTLGPNDPIEIILSSISWAYARLMKVSRR